MTQLRLAKMAFGDELSRPRKKKGADNLQRKPPFPIPIQSVTGKKVSEERWYHYFGTLRGDIVAIDRLGDMTFLYRMGFFGKGSLSKSKLEFDEFRNTFDERCKTRMTQRNSKRLTLDEKNAKEIQFDTIHNERLNLHNQWSLKKKLAETEIPTKHSRMEDPYKIDEFLQLSLEEAFFLSFGLGCLTVLDGEKEPFTICKLWNKFREIKPRFVETYATYHYYRSLGWIVRDAVIYGADFMLYKEGMPFYHSSYAVNAYLVVDDQIGGTDHSHPWTWPYLTCMNRVAEHVAKEVLISFVVKPKELMKEELSVPRCLEKFEVQEMLLRRWIPEKHREGKSN